MYAMIVLCSKTAIYTGTCASKTRKSEHKIQIVSLVALCCEYIPVVGLKKKENRNSKLFDTKNHLKRR